MQIDQHDHLKSVSLRREKNDQWLFKARESLDQNKPFFLFRAPHAAISLHYPITSPRNHPYSLVKPWNDRSVCYFDPEGDVNEKAKSIIPLSLPEETSKENYSKQFEAYQTAFRESGIEKAILSRIIKSRKPASFSPLHFFEKTIEKYPNAFVYLLAHPTHGIWAGASPEILLRSENGQSETTSLAGTIPRGAGQNWSSKEIYEQELVSDFIRRTLDYEGIEWTESGPDTIAAGEVLHLKSNFSFQSSNLLHLASQLHPTPAVAGLPRDESIELIHRTETHERRLYTGYLGEVGELNSCDLYVNLRCMQLGRDEIAFYVGGGITLESELEKEWEETYEKAKTLMNLINV